LINPFKKIILMKQIHLLLLFWGLSATLLFGQKATISGFISDAQTGERLINANVYDAKTLQGATANNYGFYSLSLPKGEVTLVVSFIGFDAQQLTINLQKDTSINFRLNLSSDEIEEVTVHGTRSKVDDSQMSVVNVPIQKLKNIPVILGEADVLKVMQLLPGVKGGTEGTSGIYVRGGGPDQNLFLLDGVPVYNASHLLGFFSVFNPDAIKAVKLYKGGFPARYGGRLSSVVDISMKDGNMKEFHGDFSVGIIATKLSLEGPIVKDKTSFIVSARRTYVDVLAQPFIAWANAQYDDNVRVGAFFHDFNLKVNHIFSDRSRLYLSGYHGRDNGYGGNKNEWTWVDETGTLIRSQYKDKFGLGWGNTIGSLRWNYLINKKLFSNTTLTYSKYFFDIKTEEEVNNLTKKTKVENLFRYYSGIEDISAKVDFDFFPTPGHEVKFGMHYTNHLFSPGVFQWKFENEDVDFEALLDSIGNREIYANELSTYIEDDFVLSHSLRMNVGAHLLLFNVEGENYLRLQPRVSLRYKANDNWSVKASYSRMAQHVHLLATSGINLPTDLWLPVTKKFEPPISDQVALGMAFNLPKDLTFTVEGYYKNMENLIEYKEGASFSGTATNWENKVEKGRGWSYGAEIMLEKTVGKTTGWVAYTLSWTERQFENINYGRVFPAKYDSRHDISVAVTHEFSKKFDIGATWVYNTGNALTLGVMEYPSAIIPGESPYNYYSEDALIDYVGRNNYRMPAYHRMDVGANFHKKKKHGVRTWSISAYNAYNRQNPFIVRWESSNGEWIEVDGGKWVEVKKPRRFLSQFSLFPIIPSISYSYKF
jgi:outer membrane receptor for ferrienterochelin and colicin